MARSNFIDKVYDTYSLDDFSYGDDNLNPIREVKPTNTQDIDEQIAAIYAALSKRVKDVKKVVADISGETTEEIFTGNAGAETNNGADDTRQNKIIKQVGSTKNKIISIPSMEDSSDPLSLELELMLLQMTLQASIDGSASSDSENKGKDIVPAMPDDLPFDCNCDDETDESDEIDNNNNDNDDNTDDISSNSSSAVSGSVNRGSNSSSSSNDSSGGADEQTTATLADISKAMQDAQDAANKASAQNAATMAQCAMAEIGFLKAILAILKVIRIIKKILDPYLGIAMEAIQIVQLAAQCWNNPTCISVIVQRVIQTVIAALMGVIASLIAQLWSLLGLDCMTAQAQNIMDEIRSALAAIGSIVSELNPTGIITDVKDMVGTIADTSNDVIQGAKDLKKNTLAEIKKTGDTIKKTISDTLGLSEDEMSDFMSNKASRARVLSSLKKFAPAQAAQIESMVTQVLDMEESVSNVITTAKKYANTADATSKLISQFRKFKDIG